MKKAKKQWEPQALSLWGRLSHNFLTENVGFTRMYDTDIKVRLIREKDYQRLLRMASVLVRGK